jgi:valyl-tRNA synthetase
VHARFQWPNAEDQADEALDGELGAAFLAALSAARKVKSEAQVSMKTPVSVMHLSGVPAGLLDPVEGDLLAVMNAAKLSLAEALPEGVPAAASPEDAGVSVALELAPQQAEQA